MPAFVHPPYGVPQIFMECMHRSYKAGAFQHDWTCGSSSRTNAVRTANGERFLESDAEYIFLVDTDMVWEPSAVITLTQFAKNRNAKVVSGWTLAYKDGIWPHAYRKDESGSGFIPWGAVEPGSEPFKVDGTGGACLLVHRDVYEALREASVDTAYPWQEETYNKFYGIQMGEDISFSHRVNSLTDYDIWYHPGAIFFHMKPTLLGPREYQTFQGRLRELTDG